MINSGGFFLRFRVLLGPPAGHKRVCGRGEMRTLRTGLTGLLGKGMTLAPKLFWQQFLCPHQRPIGCF